MMKTLKLQLFAGLFLGTLTFAGCKDECKDVDCGANGECVEGTCVCDAGYLGSDCGTALNANLTGTYTLTGPCTLSGTSSYSVTLAPKSASPLQATIDGIYGAPGHQITLVLSSNGTSFTVEKQQSGTSGYWIETTSAGSISADGKTLNMAYNVYHQGGATLLESCTSTITR